MQGGREDVRIGGIWKAAFSQVSSRNPSFKQGRHKPIQIEQEHFAHAGIFLAVGRQFVGRAAGVQIVLSHKFLAVHHSARCKQRFAEVNRAGPGEGILKQNLLPMIPGITAEQFIGALTGQAYRELLLNLAAEQQQGRVYVGHAGQVARVGRGQQSGTERSRFDDDVVMLAMQKINHHADILAVTIWLKITLCKILVVIPIINRPGVQGFATRGVLLGGQHGQD